MRSGLEVAFFGCGPVAIRCRDVLSELGISIVEPEDADLWLSVHWKAIFKPPFPKGGILNLHNSLLPWNRGAHPCTWAIIDRTPHGATMHWVDEGIDTGPIFHAEEIVILESDTGHSLYVRTVEAEVRVFRDSMLRIIGGDRSRTPQPKGVGSFHRKSDFDRLIRAMTTLNSRVVRDA